MKKQKQLIQMKKSKIIVEDTKLKIVPSINATDIIEVKKMKKLL